MDEIVQGAYLTVAPNEIRLELDLIAGIEVVDSILESLDRNFDQNITDAEARAFARRVLVEGTLTLDDVSVPWTLVDVTVPPYSNLKLGSATIKIYATVKRPDSMGARTLHYLNSYQPAKSQWTANVFLQPGGWQYQVTRQQRSNDGRQLTVNYTINRP